MTSRKPFLFAALTLLALLTLTLAADGVRASTFAWTESFAGSGASVDSCACEAQHITAEIRNDGGSVQKYLIQADFGDAAAAGRVSSFSTQSIEVPADARRTVILIAAIACDAPLQEYPFTLTAFGSSGEKISLEGTLNAVECRSLKINAPAEIPTCSGETASFDFKIVNDGETRAKGSVTTDLAPDASALSESAFDIAPGKEETVTLSLKIPSRTPPGAIPFKINAAAQGVYAEAFSKITVLDCSGLRVLMPGVVSVEPGASVKQTISLRNDAAGADSFALSLADCPSWVTLETKTVSLAASATGTATFNVNPPNEAAGKDYNCTLQAKSSKRGNVFQGTGIIRVSLPSKGALFLPQPNDVCQGNAPASVPFSLTNNGENQGTFTFTAGGAPGTLEAGLASIAPGETKHFAFQLDASQPGEYALTITAKGAYGSTSKTVPIRVLKCNSFSLKLEPATADFCPNETKNFTLTISNTGTKPDSYSVTAQAPGFVSNANGYAASLAPGETKPFTMAVSAPTGATPGARLLSVAVKSNAAQVTLTVAASLSLRQTGDASCAAFAQGAGGNGIETQGPTGAFTSLYTGLAGFLIALIAGLFVVFALAGRKPAGEADEASNGAESAAGSEKKENKTAESESAAGKKTKSEKPKKK